MTGLRVRMGWVGLASVVATALMVHTATLLAEQYTIRSRGLVSAPVDFPTPDFTWEGAIRRGRSPNINIPFGSLENGSDCFVQMTAAGIGTGSVGRNNFAFGRRRGPADAMGYFWRLIDSGRIEVDRGPDDENANGGGTYQLRIWKIQAG